LCPWTSYTYRNMCKRSSTHQAHLAKGFWECGDFIVTEVHCFKHVHEHHILRNFDLPTQKS
jgi:hypothetical protein